MTRPIKAVDLLELDPRLETVMLQGYPIPEQVIYQAARNDYSETPIHHQTIPDANKCGEWVVETLLNNERHHWGPAEHAQITLSVSGYVHSVMVQARTHRIATFDCLAGESLIDVLDGKITISELYEMYERGEKLPLIRTFNEDSSVFEYSEIGKVFKNERKDICQVILEDGKRLKCSIDHRIFTDDGWKRLKDLQVNDRVICDNNISTTIVSIGLLRNDITYDIEVDGKYHNFVCDGVVVHNCQSQRYTGKRVLKVANGELDVEDVFYVRPVGFYTNRQGRKYDWTEEHRQRKLERIVEECMEYSNYYEQGMCEEHLRDYLPQAIRQNFVVSVNLRSVLHFMDLRAKMDAQLEIQALCLQMAPILENWAPNVWNYYVEKRLHKARLAP